MDGKSCRRLQSANLCLTFSFLLHFATQSASALSITVNKEECVSETVLFPGDTVSGNFVVIDHDIFWTPQHTGIRFTITSPVGNQVLDVKGTSGHKFEFKAPRSGAYKFCFYNPVAAPEIVSFYIHTGHIPHQHDKATDEHFNPVNVRIAELREALHSVTAEQKYLKAREVRHRFTNESTRNRVIFYTLMEYVLLAIASGLQVVYIRRLFGKSIAYNRI
ncbi:hypothetical protein Dimus_016869 [Dionaea muscipula]